jgi:hypothetical protein
MTETISSNGALVRVGALATISAGSLCVIGALIPANQQSIGLAMLYLITDIGITLGLIAWYFAQHAAVGARGSAGFAVGHGWCPDYPVEWGDTGRGALPTWGFAGGGRHRRARPLCVAGGRLPVWMLALLVCSALAGIVGSLVPGLGALLYSRESCSGAGLQG